MKTLHKFQEIVELCESSKIFTELQNAIASKTKHGNSNRHEINNYSDIKEILETWRLR